MDPNLNRANSGNFTCDCTTSNAVGDRCELPCSDHCENCVLIGGSATCARCEEGFYVNIRDGACVADCPFGLRPDAFGFCTDYDVCLTFTDCQNGGTCNVNATTTDEACICPYVSSARSEVEVERGRERETDRQMQRQPNTQTNTHRHTYRHRHRHGHGYTHPSQHTHTHTHTLIHIHTHTACVHPFHCCDLQARV